MYSYKKLFAVCSLSVVLSAGIVPSVCLAAGDAAVEFDKEDGE